MPAGLWQLAVLQLLFYLFIAAGAGLYLFFRKPIIFVGLLALFSSLAFSVISFKAVVPWWGLTGDEVFIFAFLQKVIAGNFFADFFYSALPPFYPPLYFWVVGGVGNLFGLTAVQSGNLGVALMLLATPLIIYFWQVIRGEQNHSLLVLLPALMYVVSSWSAVIVKPYEFFSAVLLVVWTIFLAQDIYYKRLGFKSLIFYGGFGGLLFLTFYFWFLVLLIALAILKLMIETDFLYYFKKWFLVGVIIAVTSLPFTLPLAMSYVRFGAENWQAAWFIEEYLDLYLPFFDFSIFGAVALVGLISLFLLRQKIEIKVLGSILLACYTWQAISLYTIYFWDAPFLPAKPFLFLGGATLSAAAAFGLTELIAKVKNNRLKFGLVSLSLVLFSSQLIFGPMISSEIKYHLNLTRNPLREEFMNLKGNLEKISDLDNLTVLSSGVPEMSAFVPLDYYVSHNIHFSHPAAHFSDRFYFVRNLSEASDAKDFFERLKTSPWSKIDALLLLKGPGYYPINFYLDNYPLGGTEVEVRFPHRLIDERYFVTVFEDKQFVFLRLKD
ncbi:MAG: arabinofuranosyltransferase [Candidatus Buchananbacteria bacterium]|nr:arabinofuranosyltransferase [Candidatus Buchananbacteria bacterium]